MIVKGDKIGRNDPCPCGSGKKFKKCCIDNGATHLERKIVSKPHPLSSFNKEFLLNWFCTASILPQNHGKNVRLELLLREALVYGQNNGGSTDKQKLEVVLTDSYGTNYLEDPPVNLFTELITFYGGDYLILPGITESGVYILSTMLNGIFHVKNSLPDEFKRLVYDAACIMLAVSDYCVKTTGLGRYVSGVVESDNIILGDFEFTDAFTLTDIKIIELARLSTADPKVLQLFILRDDDDILSEDPDKNPMIVRPLQKIEGGYRILSPTNIHIALLHTIIESAISYKCLSKLIEIYVKIIWNNSLSYLSSSGYVSLADEYKLPKPSTFEHELFRFDSDKIAYVALSYDDGSGYDPKHPYYSHQVTFGSDEYDEVTSRTISELKQTYPDNEILFIMLNAGIGRVYGRGYGEVDANTLIFSVPEFDLLMRERKYDVLKLWNFSEAK